MPRVSNNINKYFAMINLREEQVPVIKDLLTTFLSDALALDDAYVCLEHGTEEGRPHIHLIFSTKRSNTFLKALARKVFDIPEERDERGRLKNCQWYAFPPFQEGRPSYEYLAKGTCRDSMPVILCDRLGRNTRLLHDAYWDAKALNQKKKNAAAAVRKAKRYDFKEEFLKRADDQKLVSKDSLIELALNMCIEMEKPVNSYYLLSVCRLAYVKDKFGFLDEKDSMLRTWNK